MRPVDRRVGRVRHIGVQVARRHAAPAGRRRWPPARMTGDRNGGRHHHRSCRRPRHACRRRARTRRCRRSAPRSRAPPWCRSRSAAAARGTRGSRARRSGRRARRRSRRATAATRPSCAATMRGARGQLVGVEDHRLVQERPDQVQRNRARWRRCPAGSAAHARRQLDRVVRRAAAGLGHAQPRAVARLFQHQHLARDRSGAGCGSGRGSCPTARASATGSCRNSLEMSHSVSPRLHGVRIGRVGRQFGQRHAGLRHLLRGAALLRRDREVGLGQRGRRRPAARRQRTRRHRAPTRRAKVVVGVIRSSSGGP